MKEEKRKQKKYSKIKEVLKTLIEKGPMNRYQLSEETGIRPATLRNVILPELEALGLVSGHQRPNDRRRVRVYVITLEGVGYYPTFANLATREFKKPLLSLRDLEPFLTPLLRDFAIIFESKVLLNACSECLLSSVELLKEPLPVKTLSAKLRAELTPLILTAFAFLLPQVLEKEISSLAKRPDTRKKIIRVLKYLIAYYETFHKLDLLTIEKMKDLLKKLELE